MIILDTNVLSELMKKTPAKEVLRWMARQAGLSLFTTSTTMAEVLTGVELLPEGRRRAALADAANAVFEEDFAGRVLPFDYDAAKILPLVIVARQKAGRPISYQDAQIAAIALCRGASLATRNIPDFEHCGLGLVNPWSA